MQKAKLLFITVVLSTLSAYADGLLVPKQEEYPHDFLRNQLTHVSVKIYGLIAVTEVYQEFKNEWDQSVDAVYSFPLPPDARATMFLYWADDTIYRAVLQVREQAPNPGTGEGGIIAQVNKYIGRNGIKVALRDIPAGEVQKVKLYYVSHCDFFAGETTYRFPLATDDFVTTPLDHLQFSVYVNSNSPITTYDCPSHPEVHILQNEPNRLHVQMSRPKAYLTQDFEFTFYTQQDELGVDFYSVDNDTMDGHFVLFIRPQNQADEAEVFPRRVIFLVSTSSNMFGYKLDQCVKAITSSLLLLSEQDVFNIFVYNRNVYPWKANPVQATNANIQAAHTYLESLYSSWGSRMDLALNMALDQITDDAYSNSLIVLSDGRSPLDPRAIAGKNSYKAGIFPIGIGDDLDYARLEMLAALNYGFTTYLSNEDDINAGVTRLFDKINRPIMKDVRMEFGRADLYDFLPSTTPSAYAGCCFFITGRYANPSESALALAGQSIAGATFFNFRLDFSSNTIYNKFAESIWAKEKIDELEREIEIYGETPALRDQLIATSLRYNIRCRYTAYVADYETEHTGVEEKQNELVHMPVSYLIGNYPNPFNPSTTINFYISSDDVGKIKLIKIYNMLGQLVAVFDVSHFEAGMHAIHFSGVDYFGAPLPSGHYFVQLQIGDQSSTLRITLAK
ncbi:T9SS C-terminal target domain-containing protein [candidate division KSB1 bacterium]|nr:T9SS type A sorting domain-containing protein [candidate division KSB1 bacterium]RQW05023.1 MAG: T9SS C-terminal target domain-containing protein [candidate division KSB1 bacterium]